MSDVPSIVTEPPRPDCTLVEPGAKLMPPLLPLKNRLHVSFTSAPLVLSICTCVIRKKLPAGSTRVLPASQASLGPCGPAKPCGPVGPVGPAAPVAPVGPAGPCGPC